VVAGAGCLVAFCSLAAASNAHADPAWGPTQAPLVAVGANTLQDLFDAYSGVAPTPGDGASPSAYHEFPPLADTNTGEQVYDWDSLNEANPPDTTTTDCISTKPGFAPIARPNGSGDGLKAVSDAIAGVAWSKASATCAPQNPAGAIDLATEASPPSGSACPFGTTACLTWDDIGHDAVAYAYYINPADSSTITASLVNQLTIAQMNDLYTTDANGNGTYTIPASGGNPAITLMACLPQLGSGTEKYFVENELGQTNTNAAEASATASGCVNFEENGATTFQAIASTSFTNDAGDSTGAPEVAVTPYSVGSWIGQANGYAFDRSSTGISDGVALGMLNSTAGQWAGQTATEGTAPSLTPNTTFESTSPFGRDLYVAMNNASVNGKATQVSSPMRDIFGYVGTNYNGSNDSHTGTTNLAPTNTPEICQAPYTTESTEFGFEAPQLAGCGAETLTVLTTGTGS
jgi:hypothetical protein